MSFDDFENARPINSYGPKPKLKFSSTEIRHIVIAIIVLTVAFSIIMFRSNDRYFSDNVLINYVYWFLICLVFVIFSFFVHELAHKYVAQQYGAWSEFRMSPIGLGLCLIISIFGFLFAAPGAVYIEGDINREQNGKIALAGPLTNLIIAALCTVLGLLVFGQHSTGGQLVLMLAWLNAFLALFNLIPIPPLDGSKVAFWNIGVYLVTLAASVVFVVLIRTI